MNTIQRWNELIALYGSQQEALARVIAAHDELDRLRAAIRAQGICPELLTTTAPA